MDKIMREALGLIENERNRQIGKWGDQSGNAWFEWMSILGEEHGELCEAVNETCFTSAHVKREKGGLEAIRREAIHVAAVACAIAEATLVQQESVHRDGVRVGFEPFTDGAISGTKEVRVFWTKATPEANCARCMRDVRLMPNPEGHTHRCRITGVTFGGKPPAYPDAETMCCTSHKEGEPGAEYDEEEE